MSNNPSKRWARCLEIARLELSKYGVSVEFERTKRHGALVVKAADGRWTKITMATSPRTCYQEQWVRQDCRRLIRIWGLT